MSLDSGVYFLTSVSFVTGEPVSRPIGAKGAALVDEIVVLPRNSPPPLWRVIKLSSDKYIISLDGKSAKVVDGSLVLSPDRGIPFEWTILRGAPSPPPIGNNSFGIIVPDQRPQESWFIGNTEGDEPVQIKIGDVASSVVIVSPLRE